MTRTDALPSTLAVGHGPGAPLVPLVPGGPVGPLHTSSTVVVPSVVQVIVTPPAGHLPLALKAVEKHVPFKPGVPGTPLVPLTPGVPARRDNK